MKTNFDYLVENHKDELIKELGNTCLRFVNGGNDSDCDGCKFENVCGNDDCGENIIAWLQQEYIEKPKKPKTIWDLKLGNEYYFISLDGVVVKSSWQNDRLENAMREQGNIFLTLEEAEFELERRKVYAIVKKYAYDFTKEDFENSLLKKYHPIWDYDLNKIDIGYYVECKAPHLYFKSEDDIQKVIKEVGEDRFIKYYLGVK